MNVSGINSYQRQQQKPSFNALGAKSIKFPKEIQSALKNELLDVKGAKKLAEKFFLGIDENGQFISYRFAGADEGSFKEIYEQAQTHEPTFVYSIVDDSIAHADIERFASKFSVNG